MPNRGADPTIIAVKIVETGHVEMFEFAEKTNALLFIKDIDEKYGSEVEIIRTISDAELN